MPDGLIPGRPHLKYQSTDRVLHIEGDFKSGLEQMAAHAPTPELRDRLLALAADAAGLSSLPMKPGPITKEGRALPAAVAQQPDGSFMCEACGNLRFKGYAQTIAHGASEQHRDGVIKFSMSTTPDNPPVTPTARRHARETAVAEQAENA